MSGLKKRLKIIQKLIYVLLPVLLLIIIFYKVDFPELAENLSKANPAIILLGILLRPIQIILGSLRWKIINNLYCRCNLPFSYMNVHYWTGLSIGFFTPGGLGWDAYRIITIGKKLKAYTAAFKAILAEKLVGLISVIGMILIMFPLVSGYLTINESLFQQLYLFMIISLILLVLFFFFIQKKKKQFINKMMLWIRNKLFGIIDNQYVQDKIITDYNKSRKISYLIKTPKILLVSLLLSTAILCVAAISGQIMFIGLNYDISLLVNLFAAPVFFILFFVPISFGSIGIREGAFILFYGQFGVPLETALLVSFFNLFGLILNSIIGTSIMFAKGIQNYISVIKAE